MNKIPKCQSKYYVPQANNIKVNQRDYFIKENFPPKITQKYIKLNTNRQFGKDITNTMRENINSIYNNHHTKIKSFIDNKSTNNVYFKKHSSASQVAQKPEQLKITINERILKEIGPNILEYYYNNKNNYLKNVYTSYPANPEGSKLYNSISYGVNNSIRPVSSINNYMSMKLSNPKNNNICTNLNNRSINLPINNNNSSIENNKYNYKNEMTQANLDLM